MHALFSSWADSIAFLWSANAKLALYGLYRAIKETYWILLTKFWWLILFFLVLHQILPISQFGFRYFFMVVWTIVTILIVRPSIEKKSYFYFAQFTYFATISAILALLFIMLRRFLHPFLPGFFSLAEGICSPFYMSTAFFMSESIGSLAANIRSILCGLKMVLYNYPLFLIIHGILFIFWSFIFVPFVIYGSKPLTAVLGPLYFYYIRIFLLPVYVCILNTLYIQRRAAQPDLYEDL